MWKGLQERQVGAVRPLSYAAVVRRMRSRELELSKHKDIVAPGKSSINSIQIDPVEDRYLLSGSGNGSISVHDILQSSSIQEDLCEKHEPLFTVGKENPLGHQFSVSSVQWYPVDTGIFISGSFDQYVNVWDANTLEVQMQFKMPARVHAVSMSPVSTSHMLIATGTEDIRVRLCDISSGAFTHTLTAHRDSVWAIKWSASCEWIVITGGRDGAIRLWDIRRAGCFFVLDQHRTSTTQKFSAADHTQRQHPGLASVSDRSTAHYGGITALETSHDGHYLISAGSDSRVKLWNIETGCNTLVNYEATRINGNKACRLAVSGDDPLVFVPCSSSIQVYNMLSGHLFSTLKGHYELVNCCAYNSQTQELYSGSNDRRILIWSPPQPLVQEEEFASKSIGLKENQAVRADEDYWSD